MEDYEYISPKTTNALVLTESQGQASPWPLKVEGTQEYYKKNVYQLLCDHITNSQHTLSVKSQTVTPTHPETDLQAAMTFL